MTTQRLTLTEDERRALLMLSYGANGAATAMCGGSDTMSAVANLLTSLVHGDVDGARWALDALQLPAPKDTDR